MSLICVAGDVHGRIDFLYAEVGRFQRSLGTTFDHLLQVGDFGIWPDRAKVDKATRRHGDVGDFPEWYAARRRAPAPTTFVKGNHEDFAFLARKRWGQIPHLVEILPDLTWLENGAVARVGDIVVGGIGGCFSGRALSGGSPGSPSHYTTTEIRQLAHWRRVDVLLTYDAPAGVRVESRGKRPAYVTEDAELRDLVRDLKPRIHFFGHHHARLRDKIGETEVVGLNFAGNPGWLVAVDTADFSIVGEWPS